MVTRTKVAASPVEDPLSSPVPAAVRPRADRFRLTLSQVWVAAVVVVPLMALLQSRLWTLDLAYQVRAGEIMLRTHDVLRTDPFSFASGGTWFDQQWLAQLVFGAAFRVGGWGALEILRALLGVLVTVLVFAACRGRGAAQKPAALLAIAAAILGFPGLILRPQLFGVALFALVQWILVTRESRRWTLLFLPAIFAVWANLHGSFILGFVLIALAIVEQIELRRSIFGLGVVLTACVVATVANPWGPSVWRYVVELSTNSRIASWVQEWQPTTIRSLPGVAFFVSVAAVLVWLGRANARPRWSTLLGLTVFFAIGLSSIRGIYWWALVAAPSVAPLVPTASRSELERPSWLNTAIAGALVFLLAVLLVPWINEPKSMLLDAPRALTSRLEPLIGPGDRVLTAQRWGSWFEYALPPHSVFVDSRIELYADEVWNDYRLVSRGGPGWSRVLDDRSIDFMVAETGQQAGLINVIDSDPGWRLLYRGDGGALFARTS